VEEWRRNPPSSTGHFPRSRSSGRGRSDTATCGVAREGGRTSRASPIADRAVSGAGACLAGFGVSRCATPRDERRFARCGASRGAALRDEPRHAGCFSRRTTPSRRDAARSRIGDGDAVGRCTAPSDALAWSMRRDRQRAPPNARGQRRAAKGARPKARCPKRAVPQVPLERRPRPATGGEIPGGQQGVNVASGRSSDGEQARRHPATPHSEYFPCVLPFSLRS